MSCQTFQQAAQNRGLLLSECSQPAVALFLKALMRMLVRMLDAAVVSMCTVMRHDSVTKALAEPAELPKGD